MGQFNFSICTCNVILRTKCTQSLGNQRLQSCFAWLKKLPADVVVHVQRQLAVLCRAGFLWDRGQGIQWSQKLDFWGLRGGAGMTCLSSPWNRWNTLRYLITLAASDESVLRASCCCRPSKPMGKVLQGLWTCLGGRTGTNLWSGVFYWVFWSLMELLFN